MCNRYEDLKLDTAAEVMKMLDYLNFDYEPGEIERRLGIDYGRFHRCILAMSSENCMMHNNDLVYTLLYIGSIKEKILNTTQGSRDL